jgi:superfamily I DNA/RNA helicase
MTRPGARWVALTGVVTMAAMGAGCCTTGAAQAPMPIEEFRSLQAARVERTAAISATGTLELRWRDDAGEHFESVDAQWWMERPESMALLLKKLGERMALAGRDRDEAWVIDLRPKPPQLRVIARGERLVHLALRQGLEFREMAVLYRAHFHSMEIQLELTRRGIPFEVTSGLRFFEQAHVKDVAAFLKFALNPSDETAFRRMVRLLPGVGEKTADSLWSIVKAGAESAAPFGEVLRLAKPPARAAKVWEQLAATLDEIAPERKAIAPDRAIETVMEAVYEDYMKAEFANYENRREDLRTLAGYARQFSSLEEFLAQIALLTNVDGAGARRDTDTDRVVLSSVHQAKGLEWRAVFVIWLTEGMFPGSRSLEKPDSLEEERRLFYVAVTRGRDHLHLCYPQIRLNSGYGEPFQRRSRFLAELPAHLLENPGADEAPRESKPAKKSGERDWWY